MPSSCELKSELPYVLIYSDFSNRASESCLLSPTCAAVKLDPLVNASQGTLVMAPLLSNADESSIYAVRAALYRWKGSSLPPSSHDIPLVANLPTQVDNPIPGGGPMPASTCIAEDFQQALATTWKKPSEGVAAYRTIPLAMAPITSPYLFINAQQRPSPPVISRGAVSDHSLVSNPARCQRTYLQLGPQGQKDRSDFLAMGHPCSCWCRRQVHANEISGYLSAVNLWVPILSPPEQSQRRAVYEPCAVPQSTSEHLIKTHSFAQTKARPHEMLTSPASEHVSISTSDMLHVAKSEDNDDWTAISSRQHYRMYRTQPPSESSVFIYSSSHSILAESDVSQSSNAPSLRSISHSPSPPAQSPEYDEPLVVSSTPSSLWDSSPLPSPMAGSSVLW